MIYKIIFIENIQLSFACLIQEYLKLPFFINTDTELTNFNIIYLKNTEKGTQLYSRYNNLKINWWR